MKCHATTKTGAPCPFDATRGSFCHRHAPRKKTAPKVKRTPKPKPSAGSDFARSLQEIVREMVRAELRAILASE